MSWSGYIRKMLTGGGDLALDGIDGGLLTSRSSALCIVDGIVYYYRANTTLNASEDSPYIIVPDDNPGTKNWILEKQGLISELGGIFVDRSSEKNPERMPWNVGLETSCGLIYGYGASVFGRYALSSATAWTMLGEFETSPVLTNGTYATIAEETSGSGVITNLVLPGVTAAGDTVGYRITVDGVEYEKSFTAENATDRFFSGLVKHFYLGSNNGFTHDSWMNADVISGSAIRCPSSVLVTGILTPNEQISNSLCIRYEDSFLVEMKSSAVSSSYYRNYGAVVYKLDAVATTSASSYVLPCTLPFELG